MNYFLTEDDLKKAMDEEREHLFTAISRALWELEHKFLLLVDTVGQRSHQLKKRPDGAQLRRNKMSEVKDLMANLKTISEGKDDDELQDIVLRLEDELEKDAEKWKDFKGELDDLVSRVKVLEGEEKQD